MTITSILCVNKLITGPGTKPCSVYGSDNWLWPSWWGCSHGLWSDVCLLYVSFIILLNRKHLPISTERQIEHIHSMYAFIAGKCNGLHHFKCNRREYSGF